MSLLNGFNHAALVTQDLDRLVAFYTEVFDAEVVFQESTPEMRHAILRVADSTMLHPVEVAGNPHGAGLSAMLGRGHLDHLGLCAASREAFDEIRRRLVQRGASDGEISDLGPQLNLWFADPDGMRAEVCWIRDPGLRSFHAPQPYAEPGTP